MHGTDDRRARDKLHKPGLEVGLCFGSVAYGVLNKTTLAFMRVQKVVKLISSYR